MSVFKNNLYSSSEIVTAAGYGSLTDSENNSTKNQAEKSYLNSNSNIIIRRGGGAKVVTQSKEYGNSTYLFWTLVVLLFVLAFGNLVITFVIIGVLRLGQGMESLEFVPDESVIKFFGNTDLDNIYKRDGKIEGFNESPMEIMGDAGNVEIGILETEREITPVINFGSKLEIIKNVESLDIIHPKSGKSIFSTHFPNFGLPRGVEKLDVQMALTRRISSPIDESLSVKSDSFVKLKGSEGIHINGKEVIWSADQDIFLKSVNRSIIFNGFNGVYVDVKNMPIASKENKARSFVQYKICVCMPEGKLFRLSVPPGQRSLVSCKNIQQSPHHNPCL